MYRTLFFSLVAFAFLTIPIAGCAESASRLPSAGQQPHQTDAPGQIEAANGDCDSISALPDKRACYAKQDQDSIDACGRIRPMHCKPYRDMHSAEKSLSAVESESIESACKGYASYVEGDAAYLKDLESYATESNRTWHAYREAQRAIEPFAQGMSRALAEDLSEACRLRMTQARIDEITALYALANT